MAGSVNVSITHRLPGQGAAMMALVNGPPFVQLPFLVRGHVVLVDKNVLLRAKESKGSSCADNPRRMWLNQLNSPDVTLNPFLYALEGMDRRVPTRDEYLEAFARGLALCRECFPDAVLVKFTREVQEETYAAVGYLADRHAAEVKFLLWAAPRFRMPVAESRRWFMVAEILDKAVELGLDAGSVVVLVVLALVFDRGGAAKGEAIAGGVIKPRDGFSVEMAHNALADVRALEMLASAPALGGMPVALCTSDRSMARLWRALEISDVSFRDDGYCGSVRVSPALYPLLDNEGCSRLLRMIGEAPKSLR